MADSTTLTAPGGATVRVSVEGVATVFRNSAGVVVGGTEDRALPTAPGATADLGDLPAGTELQFYVRADGAGPRLTGPAQLHVDPVGTDAFALSFEDLVADHAQNPLGFQRDGDFDDLRLEVRFVRPAAPLTTSGPASEEDPGPVSENLNPAPEDPDLAPEVDWNALAAKVTEGFQATGRWNGGDPAGWPEHLVDQTDWNAIAAQVTANHAATGEWFA